MFISKIKLTGFKSFSEETTLSFNENLNGIIGPNGSGKSNIVEAIKWVMGENSSKSLRGSGMNDIIFSGSASKASKNIASVTLFLKVTTNNISSSTKNYLKSGDLEVERQIIRDSGSTYRINGKEVKAKDVQFLFADLSSGSRASNIIDQGAIGNIITQKPSERRRILDEAAGISGISARKIESKNKLEATKRNLSRLSDILLDNKNRLSKLKKQAETAIRFKETSNRIEELTKNIAFAKFQRAVRDRKNIKDKLEGNRNNYLKKLQFIKDIEIEKDKVSEILEKLQTSRRELQQDNLNLDNLINQTNLEKENTSKQLESLKSLKEQIKRNENFQNEILENSISRLKVLEHELSKNEAANNIKNFEVSEKKHNEIKNALLKSDEIIEITSLKLSNKKELVNNKEYEKSLLIKKINSLDEDCKKIKESVSHREDQYKNTSHFDNLEKNRLKIKNNNQQGLLQLRKYNEKLKQFSDLENLTKKEIEKVSSQLVEQSEKTDDIKNQITVFSSLGFKNTQKNIIKNIRIDENYKLAFYLALGDRIEASKDDKAPVIWNAMSNKIPYSLPKEVKCINHFVEGPKEIQLFLSQVGIVNSNEDGNRYQKKLRPGQTLVSKEGVLWKWDGLHIKDGKETITYKRIISTTKLIKLEKEHKKEDIKATKLKNIKGKIDIKYQNIKKEIDKIEKKIGISESFLASNNQNLVEIERDFLINKSKKELDLEEIIREKEYLKEKTSEKVNIKNEIKLIEDYITKESGNIVNLRKKLSDENKENRLLKDNYENFRIQFEINKKQRDAVTIQKEKTVEEISATHKQIQNTKNILLTLKEDIKRANYEESILLKSPVKDKPEVKDLNIQIDKNNINIKKTEDLLSKKKYEQELVLEKLQSSKMKLEIMKEETIRKEAQLEQLNSFISGEEERIDSDLRISKSDLYSAIKKSDFSGFDIRNSEIILRNLKIKNQNTDDINLSAENELKELESKINDILVEEKDLNNASKKLEKAIQQLNKEARNRVISTFSSINSTFTELFKKLFDGGKAHLELIDSDDPLEAGLELLVSPPGKKLQRLSLLSGGEKALASIALIFSTFVNRQTPICILDEVDAPLDDFNVERFCNLLKETTKISDKKFLVITHNRITMGYMNKIYGVTMNEPGVSKLVSVNLDKISSEFAAE